MTKAKVLVTGSGGREHALVWKLGQNPDVEAICAPGNAGTDFEGRNVPIKVGDFEGIAGFVRDEGVGLTVVGPEDPLVNGIVDYFHDKGLVEEGHLIFGPNKDAAMLEGSKAFAKEFMKQYGIPTADFSTFTDASDAKDYLNDHGAPIVVKASGLAAGKGAIVCKTLEDAISAVDRIMVKKDFGDAGNTVVIEDFMEGEEASILALTDGKTVLSLASSQDHKPVYDNDEGSNTGGMGAYAPASIVTPEVMQRVNDEILVPTVYHMSERGTPFVGCLYAGLMIKDGQPRVVEFNIRFGDPEAQPVLSLLNNDLYSLLKACVTGDLDQHEISNKEGASCCVVLASQGYPGPYDKNLPIHGLEEADKMTGVKVFHAGTSFDNGLIIATGGRVLDVNAYSKMGIADARRMAYGGVGKITVPGGFHFRTDIARGK